MALIESMLGGTAISILEQALKAGKYAVGEAKGAYNSVQQKQQLLAASDRYVDNYLKRHCQIKIMPGLMTEPRELGSIYTAVKLLDSKSRIAFLSLIELENAYREKGNRELSSATQRIEGIDAANKEQFLMVLGGPGIGKSTFLRKIGLEALTKDGTFKHNCVPVFLELKKLREQTVDIKKKIIEEFDICQFPEAEAFVEAALKQGKLLVLFDGLDEVPSENINQVIEQIEDFVDKYTPKMKGAQPQNRFVVSCRTAAYRQSFRLFVDVTIAEFNHQQIEEFIYRWFSSPEDKALGTAKEYIELINQRDYSATKELAQTPLLLTFLCLVYDREQTLPSKRSTLYGRALNIILNEWSAQKRIKRSEIYKGFHPDLEKGMLAAIAYESFHQDQLFFSKYAIKEHISSFLADTLGASIHMDASAVLEAIEVQQGILVERAADVYTFSHLTLQEYLTALYIVENRLENKLVEQHLTNERWREVFLLVAGLMNNSAPNLLSQIEQKSFTFIENSLNLKHLIEWATINKEGTSKLSQKAAMIVIAIAVTSAIATSAIATSAIRDDDIELPDDIYFWTPATPFIYSAGSSSNTIASALNNANADAVAIANTIANNSNDILDADSTINQALRIGSRIASIASGYEDDDIEHHFFKSDILQSISTNLSIHDQNFPGTRATEEEWYMWLQRLGLVWAKALDLELDIIKSLRSDADALRDYLYAIELLLKCKESAIYISRSQWESLEKRLLTLEKGEIV